MQDPEAKYMKSIHAEPLFLETKTHEGILLEIEYKRVFMFCEANWGGSFLNKLSWTGYALMMNIASIYWKYALQKSQALSTSEAKYIARYHAG